MIQGIGYTEDGKVWMAIMAEWNGERGKIVVNFTPAMAIDVAGALVKASDGASAFVKEVADVRNRTDLN
jgi:hypothetical protein